MLVQEIFDKLKNNANKMIELLRKSNYNGKELMNLLNERNKLFEKIYNTKLDKSHLDQVKELIDQTAQIMNLVEQKKTILAQNFADFQKNSKNIMKYLKQGGQT